MLPHLGEKSRSSPSSRRIEIYQYNNKFGLAILDQFTKTHSVQVVETLHLRETIKILLIGLNLLYTFNDPTLQCTFLYYKCFSIKKHKSRLHCFQCRVKEPWKNVVLEKCTFYFAVKCTCYTYRIKVSCVFFLLTILKAREEIMIICSLFPDSNIQS